MFNTCAKIVRLRHNSRIAFNASINNLAASQNNGHTDPISFIHLAITDSGGGINIDDRSRVFDPQYRADHPLIDGLGDTGAGMAIARTLTEANGGRVWLDSQTGEGCTLSVLFPITPELPPENGAVVNGNGASA